MIAEPKFMPMSPQEYRPVTMGQRWGNPGPTYRNARRIG